MSYGDWKDKISDFKTKDVRGLSGNFFPGLKKFAMKIEKGGRPRFSGLLFFFHNVFFYI